MHVQRVLLRGQEKSYVVTININTSVPLRSGEGLKKQFQETVDSVGIRGLAIIIMCFKHYQVMNTNTSV